MIIFDQSSILENTLTMYELNDHHDNDFMISELSTISLYDLDFVPY